MSKRRQKRALSSQGPLRRRALVSGDCERLERRVLFASAVTLTPDKDLAFVLGNVGDFQLDFDGVPGHVYGGSSSTPGNGGVVIRLADGTTNGLPNVVNGSAAFSPISDPAADDNPVNGSAASVTAHFSGGSDSGGTYEVTQSVAKPVSEDDDFVRVENTIQNTTSGALTLSFYAAADLFLGGTDGGTGFFTQDSGAVGSTSTDGRYQLFFQPDSSPAPAHHFAGFYGDLWHAIGIGSDLPDTVNNDDADEAIGLEWKNVTIPASGTVTFAYYVAFTNVVIGPPDDPPEAAGAAFSDITDPAATKQTIQVTWSDPEAIDRSTMGDGDILVTGPNYSSPGKALSLEDDGGAAGDGALCTYSVDAPAGGFLPGLYTVEVARDQVLDDAGKAVPRQVLGTFQVGPQKLAVTPTADAATLANALINGDGIHITGTPTFDAPPASDDGAITSGTFGNPEGVLGLTSKGIVFSTGDVRDAGSGGARVLHGPGTSYGLDSTNEQNALIAPLTNTGFNQDCSQLDLKFDVAPGVTEITFQIVLATQDAKDANSSSDAFALLVNGENVALDADASDAPITARSADLAPLTGTGFTRVLAPSGNPVIKVTVPVDAGSTGNTMTLILADADGATGDTAAYVSAFAGTQPAPVTDFDESFGGANGTGTPFVAESVVAVGDKTIAAGFDIPNGGVPRFILERYDADGTLDQSFGDHGRTVTAIGGLGGHAYDVVAGPDGRIYAAGDANGDLAVAAYSADGIIDNTFGTGGIAKIDLLGFDGDAGYALVVDPATGKIIVAGTAGNLIAGKLTHDFAVARFTSAGQPDSAFGPSGTGAFTQDAGRDDGAGAVVLSQGGIVVAGNASQRVFVARLTDAGVLDMPFGGGDGIRYLGGGPGKTNLLYSTDFTVGLAAQPDGKLLVAASTAGDGSPALTGSDFGLVRLNPNGLLDGDTFGTGALTSTDFGGTDDADSVVVLPDGRIVVSGTYLIGDTINSAVAVYDSTGAPATDFAVAGRSFFDAANASEVLGSGPGGADSGDFGTLAVHIGDISRRIKASASPGGATVPSFDGADASILRRLAIDKTAPTASFVAVPDVTVNGLPTVSISVDFSDAFGIDVSDIAAGNIQVVRAGSDPLVVTGVTVSVNTDGSPRRATYTAAAPGGKWDAGDNGTYTVTLLDNQVSDTSNNLVAQTTLGSFNVAVIPPPPQPVATLQPVTAPVNGAATVTLQLIYTDDDAVNTSTIDVNDLAVARAGGAPLTVQSVSLDNNANGTPRTATYTLLAPDGSWDVADNGTYTISVQANQVADLDGSPHFAAAGQVGSFNVNFPPVDNRELLGTLGGSASPKFTGADADGTTFLLTLTGGGIGNVFRDGASISIDLTQTSPATNLTIKTKSGGDGRVKLSGLTADGGLKALTGKTTDLAGTLNSGGPLAKLAIANATGSTITIGAGGPATIALGQVSNTSITAASFLKSLKTGPWTDDDGTPDAITATAGAGAVKAAGDFGADLIVGGLASLKATGALTGSAIRSAGPVGKVTAAAMTNSLLFAGVKDSLTALPATLSDFTNPLLTIAGVKISGAFSDSAIAAGSIGKVALGTASTTEADTFGVAADHVAGVTATLLPLSNRVALKKLETPDQTLTNGTFTVRVL